MESQTLGVLPPNHMPHPQVCFISAGTIAVRNVVQISAGSIDDVGGRIQGKHVQGAMALADQDVDLTAGRNVNILAAQQTQQQEQQSKTSSTGIGLIPGLAPSQTFLSVSSTKQSGQASGSSPITSLISANAGNLTITAGADEKYRGTGQGNVTSEGADLLAGQATQITGNQVDLKAAGIDSQSASQVSQHSFTIGSQVTGTVGSLITQAYNSATQDNSNDRLTGALALKAGYDAYKALAPTLAAGGSAAEALGNSGSAFGVQFSVGASSYSAQQSEQSHAAKGTNIQAQDLTITSRDTDINAQGAKLQASNITLDAARDLNLGAAQNTESTTSKEKGSSAMVGVTAGLGTQNGFSVQLGVSAMSGKANGSATSYDNTLVTATDTLTLKSGRDANLIGAQVAGNTVKADIGGNLIMTTLQDQSSYQSSQESGGFGISLCIPPICGGSMVTASASFSDQSINHGYQSAVGQTGIAAGTGGFDINVKGKTELNGAAITSEAPKEQNKLRTESLTYTDLTNTQHTDSDSTSISASFDSKMPATSLLATNAMGNLAGNLAATVGMPASGDQTSQTLSVISPANITITGGDQQSQEAVATLTSRDASTANQSLTNTLTLQQAAQIKAKQQQAQENAQAAQLVGSVLTNAIGAYAKSMTDKGSTDWGEGSLNKTVLHGLAGLIEAKIAGGSAAAGIAAGVLNEQLTNAMSNYLINSGIPATIQDQDGREIQNPDFASMMQLGSSLVGAAAGGLAGGNTQSAALGQSVALTATQNNFLNHIDKALLDKLRAKGTNLTADESKELISLETADQLSDALLDKARSGQALTDNDVTNLALYLGNYAQVEGPAAASALLQNGNNNQRDYTFPYAGTPEAQKAFMDQLVALNGGGLGGLYAAYVYPGRSVSSDENQFTSARIDAGWFLNTNPNTSFLPTSQATQAIFNGIDVLESSVLASGGYLAANLAGADSKTQNQIAMGLAILSNVGSSFVLPKVGLGPAFGETVATPVNSAKTGMAVEPAVTARGTINGAVFEDVNQTAKVGATNEPTLIADRVAAKAEAQGKLLPNGTVADSHAEIGIIQQAYNAGKTQGAEMFMTVSGKDVCGYCKGDIAAAADAAGLKSLTVQAVDDVTGLPKTYYWEPGMKSIKEKP